jgi:small subunit ribosomal protein S4
MGIAPSRRGQDNLFLTDTLLLMVSKHSFTTLNLVIKLLREKSKSLEAIERSLSNASQVYEWITWNNDVKEGTFYCTS